METNPKLGEVEKQAFQNKSLITKPFPTSEIEVCKRRKTLEEKSMTLISFNSREMSFEMACKNLKLKLRIVKTLNSSLQRIEKDKREESEKEKEEGDNSVGGNSSLS